MIFNVRSINDVRALLYVLLPMVATILVTYNVFRTEEEAGLWVALVLILVSTGIQTFKTANAFRKTFYSLVGAVGAILVFYKIVEPGFLDAWLPLIIALVGGVPGAIAAQNVNTTPAEEVRPTARA